MSGRSSRPTEDDARAALDRDGFALVRGVVDAEWLERLRAAFESAGRDVDRTSGTRHVRDMSDPAFGAVLRDPRILGAVAHVLGDAFAVRDMHGRDPLPGFGQQGLHADWPGRSKGE